MTFQGQQNRLFDESVSAHVTTCLYASRVHGEVLYVTPFDCQHGRLVSKLGGKRKNDLATVTSDEAGQYAGNSGIFASRTFDAESHGTEDTASVQGDIHLPTQREDIQVRRFCT
jgi:hypothetical protein